MVKIWVNIKQTLTIYIKNNIQSNMKDRELDERKKEYWKIEYKSIVWLLELQRSNSFIAQDKDQYFEKLKFY